MGRHFPSQARTGSAKWLAVVLVATLLLAVAINVVPSGPDIYVHLAWSHQVMRTLVHGELPLWMPDLNAGCGSPGIRLYSPGGPFLAGLAGLLLERAGAGIRFLVFAMFGLFLILMRHEGVERPGMALLLAVTATPVLADLATRAAISEVLAVPLAWWLLDRITRPRLSRPFSLSTGAIALACLWLLHAPTTVMVVILLGSATLLRRFRPLGRLTVAGGAAALLTAWHWLPLGAEMHMMANRPALTSGIFVATNNVLGSPHAHSPLLNAALSLAAIALLLTVLIEGWHRSDPLRAALIVLAIALASSLASPLYASGSPLAWLQFPWRWLLPAFLLALRPLALRPPISNRRGWALGALWILPLLALPLPALVAAPGLTIHDGWRSAGRKMMRSIGGNPLYVDATQNRPPWYALIAAQLPLLGGGADAAGPAGTRIRVVTWKPLVRVLGIDAATAAAVTVRLLDYPWWQPSLDGRQARTIRRHGLLTVNVPPGRHRLTIVWTGNPLSRAGLALFLSGVLVLWFDRRFSRRAQ